MNTATGEEVLSVAAREIGYHEGKNKSNKYGEWFGLNHVQWCVEFVNWVYHNAGISGPILGLTRDEGGTASCGELLGWYKMYQPDCISKEPIPGCPVIFDWPKTKYDTDHIGLFVRMDKTTITTIDGNTGNDEGNGGYVEQKTRKLSFANPVFIVPRELEEDMNIDKLIDEMTEAQAYKIYNKAYKHMQKLPLPTTWNSKEQLAKAVKDGITSGENPMCPTTRLEAAIMADRAYNK